MALRPLEYKRHSQLWKKPLGKQVQGAGAPRPPVLDPFAIQPLLGQWPWADLPRSVAGTLPEPEVAGSWVETPQAGADPAPSAVAGLCSSACPERAVGRLGPMPTHNCAWHGAGAGGNAWPPPNTLCAGVGGHFLSPDGAQQADPEPTSSCHLQRPQSPLLPTKMETATLGPTPLSCSLCLCLCPPECSVPVTLTTS